MSKTTTLFVIFACLTTAFALEATLAKEFFFVNTYNDLSYKLFHTTNGIIAYNLENTQNGPVPQYLLLDPVQGTASPILEGILISCDHTGGAIFDRLQYHVQTSTLAYFCGSTNSLLILNEKTYAIEESIPTGILGNFSEAKLTADGSSLYVLLTGTLYKENQVPSQLVQYDLSSRKIVGSFVFDQYLADEEYVNGFVSQGSAAFVLTNTLDSSSGVTTVSIYSAFLTETTYNLFQFANFSTGGYTNFLSQLYLVGDYLAVNNGRDLIFMTKQGSIISTYTMIGSKLSPVDNIFYLPSMVAQDGSSDLYVLFYSEGLFKFTPDSTSNLIVPVKVGTAYDFQVAYGNHYTNDLLFTIDTFQTNFSITTLQNSDLIYTSPSGYDSFVLSNTTFGILKLNTLYVYDRHSNALIGNISMPSSLHLQYDSDTLYYSQRGSDMNSCLIMQLDLTTLSTQEVQSYPNIQLCENMISQFQISESGFPEFVVSNEYFGFTIVSESYGIIDFKFADLATDTELIVPNFDTMSVYRLQSNSTTNSTLVSYYTYNGTGFVLEKSYVADTPYVSSFYASGSNKAIAFSTGSFRVIDLENGSTKEYSFPTDTTYVSSIQGNALIFSDSRTGGDWNGNVTQPSLFNSNGVSSLPGTNSYTVQAGAAGPSSYWIVDGYISSVGLVKFYEEASAQESFDIFSILQ